MRKLTLQALGAALRDEDYPLTSEYVRDEYGDLVLDLPGGEERVADVLDRVDDAPHPDFASAIASIHAGVSGPGVGRRHYTDRGGTIGENKRESF